MLTVRNRANRFALQNFWKYLTLEKFMEITEKDIDEE